jgi:hypothetical protein
MALYLIYHHPYIDTIRFFRQPVFTLSHFGVVSPEEKLGDRGLEYMV